MQKDISLSHGNAKRFPRMLPIYDRNIIPDYNGEGFDSVDSQEFDYPHGCTVKPQFRIIPDPPPVPDYRTAEQRKMDEDNMRYYFETQAESEAAQDKYLKKFGI